MMPAMSASKRLRIFALLAGCGGGGGGTTGGTTGTGETTGGGMSFPGSTSAPTSGAPTSGEVTGASGTSSTGAMSTATSGADTTGGTGTDTGSAGTSGSTSAETGESSSTSAGESSTGAGESSETSESTGGSTAGESGESTGGGVCGDGIVDPGEECDDLDMDDDDECSNACVLATCEDGEKNGDEVGVDCGGSCQPCQFVLLLGGNAGHMVGGMSDGLGWTTTDIAAPTVDGLDVGITTTGRGIGVFRYTKQGDPKDQQLQYVTWTGGVWSAPQQVGVATTRAAPTLDRAGTGAHVVFHGENFQFYYAAFDGMGWAPAAEMVGSFGPGPGGVATLGIEAMFVFHDGAQSNHLTGRRRNANWLAGQTIDLETQAFDRQPAVATLGTSSAIAVHALNNGGQLRWSIFKNGGWSGPLAIAGAQTSAAPALVGLGADAAALAFRGGDGLLYVTTWDGQWSAPAPVAEPNAAIFGPPALARGIGAADLEVVYVEAGSKVVRHIRRISGQWSAPKQVGNTTVERVAIASGP